MTCNRFIIRERERIDEQSAAAYESITLLVYFSIYGFSLYYIVIRHSTY